MRDARHDRIVEALRIAGLSQERLATELDYSRAWVGGWLRGEWDIPLDKVPVLLALLPDSGLTIKDIPWVAVVRAPVPTPPAVVPSPAAEKTTA